jgi:hypothetical protein
MPILRFDHYEEYQKVVMENAGKWANEATVNEAMPVLVVLDRSKGSRYAFRPCETTVQAASWGLYKCDGDEPFVLLVDTQRDDSESKECKDESGKQWCRWGVY